jgi:hypothetical protein
VGQNSRTRSTHYGPARRTASPSSMSV